MLAAANRNLLGLAMTFDPSTDGTPTGIDDSYASAINQVAPNATAVIQAQAAPGESWTDTLQRSLPILVATYQQKQILDVQMQRAKAGLPPLDASQYAAGVQVGLSSDTQKMLLFGALGIAALFFVMNRRSS